MPDRPADDEDPYFWARVGVVGGVFVACIAAPSVGMSWGGRWAALAGGVAGLVVWVRLGPRPMPGFLPGLISVSGLVAIVAAGVIALSC